LETKTVGVARHKSYVKAWQDLKEWAKAKGLSIESKQDLDHAVVNKMNYMFFDGHDVADAMTLLAAVKFHRQDIPKTGALVRAPEALSGFRKLDPPKGRLPMPYPMLAAVVRRLWGIKLQVSMWLLVGWATCCRPGEALKLRKKDIVPPTDLCPHWIIILNCGLDPTPKGPFANAAADKRDFKLTSKVGVSDEAIIVDQPYMKNLGKIMLEAVKGKANESLMFDFDTSEAVKLWNESLMELGYIEHGINCTYQIRHGSASTDVLTGLRTLTEIQKRGRWEAAKSVKRYTNGGRISQVYDNLSGSQKHEAAQAEVWINKILEHGHWDGKF
jgi:integrase